MGGDDKLRVRRVLGRATGRRRRLTAQVPAPSTALYTHQALHARAVGGARGARGAPRGGTGRAATRAGPRALHARATRAPQGTLPRARDKEVPHVRVRDARARRRRGRGRGGAGRARAGGARGAGLTRPAGAAGAGRRRAVTAVWRGAAQLVCVAAPRD